MTGEAIALRHAADVLVSNVDKKSVEGERPVRLCNYTNVYYQARITGELDFMSATATPGQVVKFGLRGGDSIITKDSETPSDIAVPAYVPTDLPGVVCGYHLALIRPRASVIDPGFLGWALESDFMREQFASRASGVTRYGLTYEAIQGAQVPLGGPRDEQRRIADFLDDQVTRIDDARSERRRQRELLRELLGVQVTAALNKEGGSVVPIGRPLASRPSYGVLKPVDYDGSDGVPLLRIFNLSEAGRYDLSDMMRVPPTQSREFKRTVLQEGDVVLSVVGTLGRVAMVDSGLAGANLSRALCRMTRREGVPPGLLLAWLRAPAFSDFCTEVTQGTAQAVLNMGDVVRYRVRMPSSRALADRVAVAAGDLFDEHELSQQAIDRSVALLDERKRALITAAVTGEFDVSTAGPRAASAVTA